MSPFQTDLSDASSWCDSLCDRCPLLTSCKVGQAVSRRIRRMGEDDGMQAVITDVTRDLNRALVMLEDACEQEGIDTSNLEPIPVPELVTRAEGLGRDLAAAAMAMTEEAVRRGRIDQVAASRLVGNATLVVVKTVRVSWELADGEGADDFDPDIQPILLLIERASAELRRDARLLAPLVPPLLAGRLAAAHGAMIDLITPWVARISAGVRAELHARIAAGCAPSPFCRHGSEGGARA